MNLEEKPTMTASRASPQAEHLYYVRCSICNTILARMLDTVTVKCGHCGNLSFLTTTPPLQGHVSLTLQVYNTCVIVIHTSIILFIQKTDTKPIFVLTKQMQSFGGSDYKKGSSSSSSSSTSSDQPPSPSPPFVVKPPEKKQRLPSAYNRFMRFNL
nr:F4N2.14 [Arabidopsis thaliana]